MKIKKIKISKGDNDFSMKKFHKFDHNRISVEFDTEEPDYKLKYYKYGRGHVGNAYVFDKNNQNFNAYLMRDGLTSIMIESNCDGILTVKFKKIKHRIYSDAEIKEMREEEMEYQRKASKKNTDHYLKYFRIYDDFILIHNDYFKDFEYAKWDEPACKMMEEQCKHHMIYKNPRKELTVFRGFDIFQNIKINSREDTKCYINFYNSKYPFDIKRGIHTYPFLLPISINIFGGAIILRFEDECIESVEISGIYLNRYISQFLKSEKVICYLNDEIIILEINAVMVIYNGNKDVPKIDNPLNKDKIKTITHEEYLKMVPLDTFINRF